MLNKKTNITDDVKKQMTGSKGEILIGDYFREKGCENVKISSNPFSAFDVSLTYKGKLYKNEIKTQTPFIKAHKLSYSLRPAQREKLKQIDFVYFLCKADNALIGSSKFEGQLYKANAIDIFNWIQEKHRTYPNFKYNILIKNDRYNNFWINIPMKSHFLKLVHTFPKKDMIHFREIGVSQYKTNKNNELVKKYYN